MAKQITSDKNYMKRHPASGSRTMKGPDTSRFFGSWYTRDLVIPHGIGKPPMIRVFYEPFLDGKVFEAAQDGQYYYSNPINTYGGTEDAPTLMPFVDDQNLYIRMFFFDNRFQNTDFNIHAIIYWDYGMTP